MHYFLGTTTFADAFGFGLVVPESQNEVLGFAFFSKTFKLSLPNTSKNECGKEDVQTYLSRVQVRRGPLGVGGV